MDTVPLIFQLLLACTLCFFLTLSLRRIAPALKLIDLPDNDRKTHSGTPALVGGLAVFLTWVSMLTFFQPDQIYTHTPLFVAAFMLIITGVLDDRFGLGVAAKLVMQISAAILITLWGGMTLADIGNLLQAGDPIKLHGFGIPFTVLCIVVLLNAWNMMDGLDGLASGISLTIFGWFCLLAFFAGLPFEKIIPALFMILSLIGFLPLNKPSKKLGYTPAFLGDAGSLFLGGVTSWIAISLAQHGDSPALPPIVIAWILAFPVFDMIRVSTRRIMAGKSPLRADKQHLHHLLLAHGYTPARTVRLLLGITFIYGGIGYIGWSFKIPEPLLTAAWIIMLCIQYALSEKLWHKRK